MSILNPLNYPVCFYRPLRLDSFSAWVEHIPFGMLMVDMLRPKILVELGTYTGVSYSAFCQAVKQLGLDTRCYAVDTWKGDAHAGLYGPNIFANLRSHHDPLYGEFSRLIQSTFDEAVNYFSDASVDLLHIDGLHTYEAVKRDFGVWKLWVELQRKYPYFEFVHGHGLGVVTIGEKPFDLLEQLFSASEDETRQIREFFFLLGSRLSAEIAKQKQIQNLSHQLAGKEQIVQALSAQISEKKQAAEAPSSELNQKEYASKPGVSVVVVVYNMAREAPRTLHSLSTAYQRHIDPDAYEVIVVDNGSNPPLDPQLVARVSGNFRLIRIDQASPSPAQAVNRGLAEARGEVVGVMIDGARIATPGLLHFARQGTRLARAAVVAAPGWYLGYDLQRWAMRHGYDQPREDALLAAIEWPQDGYRLFEIATMDESSVDGWLQPISEANALFMRSNLWDKLGGMDERFDAPGGGLVNLDMYSRAMELPDAQLVLLLGEGTFHQLHGGIATNASPEEIKVSFPKWDDQYERLRGRRYQKRYPEKPPMYVGTLPRPALARFVRAAVAPAWGHKKKPPLGQGFDQQLWSPEPPLRPADSTIAALVKLAQQEFRCGRYESTVNIARLIRSRAPDELEPQRLLSLSAQGPEQEPPNAESFFALGEAHRLLGENESAALNYRKALTFNSNLAQAHIGLANLRMPGDGYLVWLERLYGSLAPETVIEIGVYKGSSLALLQPPTVAIGIDPTPTVTFPLKTETHIFAETSDEFFAQQRPETLLAGRPLSVAFIDGLHLYEQALKDFVHLEMYCGPRSVVLFHDTVPLDEATQSRECNTQFHTGDVWKTVLCLKHYRPDLDVFTIATPWTGLTVVTGLDPASRVLADRYDEAVARFIDMPFSDIEDRLDDALNIVPNEWEFVEARLRARQIL